MRLLSVLSRLALVLVVTSESGRANEPASPSQLTQQDKSAIASILNALVSEQGEELNQTVIGALDASGVDGQSVVRAIKYSAGLKLDAFQRVLTQTCLGGHDRYCQFAALHAPSADADVRTAATDASGGAGGGATESGGVGGTPQLNRGHTSFSPSPQTFVRDPAQNLLFNLNFAQAPSSSVNGSVTTSTTIVLAPGPIAGAGWSGVVAAGGALWLLRRRTAREARFGEGSRRRLRRADRVS